MARAADIFGRDGAKNLANGLDVPFLGQIPLVQGIREGGDAGVPVMVTDDLVSRNAFKIFAGNAVRGIAVQNAGIPSGV